MATSRQDGFRVTTNKELDSKAGPYTSLASALSSIDESTERFIGFTFKVITGNNVVEWWFQDGIADGNAAVKVPGSGIISDHGALSGLTDDDHTQYHTDARALTWLGTRSTTDLSEGTNLYYTEVRVSANTDVSANTTARHTHANQSTLDAISDAGSGQIITLSERQKLAGFGDVLQFRGTITIAADFPTLASVETGYLYRITATVTDNDATRTNTGLTFSAGEEIFWDGSTWIVIGVTGLTTTEVSEGVNLYYTDARANAAIDARVNKAFVDALNIDADTIDGLNSTSLVQSVSQGSGITISGTTSVIVSHADTSTQSSVTTAGNNIISDITLDGFGHITAITTRTLNAGSFNIQVDAGPLETITSGETVQFISGTNVTLSRTGNDITINTTVPSSLLVGDANNTYSVTNWEFVADTSDGSDTKSVMIAGGGSRSTARGASIVLNGNEHVTDPGDVRLIAGQTGNIVLSGTTLVNTINNNLSASIVIQNISPTAGHNIRLVTTNGEIILSPQGIGNALLTDTTIYGSANIYNVSSGTWNLTGETGNNGRVFLTQNITTINVTNLKNYTTYNIEIVQDGTGGRTMAFPAAWNWAGGTAPTISSGANNVDILTLVTFGDTTNGVFASLAQNFS